MISGLILKCKDVGFIGVYKPAFTETKAIDLVGITLKAAKTLADKARKTVPPESMILSTSLADINDLSKTTTLGRVISEQLSSRLSDQGFKLKEIKMRDNVFISEDIGGEFTLSRRLKVLSKSHDATAILAGTYAIGSQTIYVNVRLIDTTDNIVLATADFQLPLDADMRALTQTDTAFQNQVRHQPVTRTISVSGNLSPH